MTISFNEESKERLLSAIERDAEASARNIAEGADPTLEARAHLARTGKFHRRLREIELIEETS